MKSRDFLSNYARDYCFPLLYLQGQEESYFLQGSKANFLEGERWFLELDGQKLSVSTFPANFNPHHQANSHPLATNPLFKNPEQQHLGPQTLRGGSIACVLEQPEQPLECKESRSH